METYLELLSLEREIRNRKDKYRNNLCKTLVETCQHWQTIIPLVEFVRANTVLTEVVEMTMLVKDCFDKLFPSKAPHSIIATRELVRGLCMDNSEESCVSRSVYLRVK